jgi:transcriptional regulator
MENVNEIVIYQPDEIINLEVRVENESVWLTLNQIALLFDRDKSVISRHIANIFKEKELSKVSTVAKNATVQMENGRSIVRQMDYYNLDVIISVGYRVKSQRGTQFRIWANQVLKEYLLKGYAINSQLTQLEQRVDKKLFDHEQRISNNEKQIGFFVRTSLPPVEGVFCDGQIFDAYVFVSDLIKSAKTNIVLIDNYVDESVLLLLSKRNKGVSATIYTKGVSQVLQQDLHRHNLQYEPIEIQIHTTIHDRFLVIDNTVYHIGASLKDLGKKLFAFSKMELEGKELLNKM